MNFYYKKRKGYRKVQVNTATPEKLLIMCYDGLLKFLKTSRLLMEKQQKDKANVYILKAINVLVELIATLKTEESPEFSNNLRNLYVYILGRLRDSVSTGEVDGVEYSIQVITQLKEAWEDALSKKPDAENLPVSKAV